ncbi:nucleotidyltransferase domain-containing protein [Leptolyngbya iicbica]|uniref:Nucleotidyltransferase domain-containing protein n=2 Tax=Cyanophyceae TaxID=3028117 RepID=A0A4Q7EF25_9CYAN|nr:nucleotidyltransferase domain-containing protein [Leptolyngbya sp. LK]RZM81812.1 nucleotidyltransferase domain-containing protein [Leptolyngbya sp. LK]
MPVRSLNSSILRWPSRDEVDQALRQWVARHEPDLTGAIAIGYFGSYARGDAGVGSDLDVVMILRQSDVSFTQRSQQWNFLSIPVPVEAQIYTAAEWAQLTVNQPRFHSTLVTETVWLSCPRSRNETAAESSAVAVGEGDE